MSATPAQLYQALRAQILSGFLSEFIADPLISPYANPGAFPPLITGLNALAVSLRAGTESADIAGLRINQWIHTWSAVLNYYFTNDFVADLSYFTNISGGPSNLWDNVS